MSARFGLVGKCSKPLIVGDPGGKGNRQDPYSVNTVWGIFHPLCPSKSFQCFEIVARFIQF